MLAFQIISFILGLCIGSFLNVVIFRLERGESAATGRSYCPHCHHQLDWRDLVPVLSFLLLRGKCRFCHGKISWQYPLVEIATGLLFLAVAVWKTPDFSLSGVIALLFFWYVAGVLLVIFVYDLKYFLIPDQVLFPAIAIAFAYRLLDLSNGIALAPWQAILPFWGAALAGSAFFGTIYAISSGRWMGFGDVKLAVLLGLLLGLPAIFTGLFLAFLSGALVGTVLLFLQKKGLKSEVPFAPFLIAGTLVAMAASPALLDWYTGLILLQ